MDGDQSHTEAESRPYTINTLRIQSMAVNSTNGFQRIISTTLSQAQTLPPRFQTPIPTPYTPHPHVPVSLQASYWWTMQPSVVLSRMSSSTAAPCWSRRGRWRWQALKPISKLGPTYRCAYVVEDSWGWERNIL